MGDLGKQIDRRCGSIAFKSVREPLCRGAGVALIALYLDISNT
jgi:hypothetical protein